MRKKKTPSAREGAGLDEIAEAFAEKIKDSPSHTTEEKARMMEIVGHLDLALKKNQKEAVSQLVRIFQREFGGLKRREHLPEETPTPTGKKRTLAGKIPTPTRKKKTL